MHRKPRATCAQILAFAAATLLLPLHPASAQTKGNPPKLQKKLEAVAAKLDRHDLGPVKARSATVGDHLLTIEFEPSTGVDDALATKSVREISWDRAICSNKDALEFISEENVTVRVTLALSTGVTEKIAEVTGASCAREATIDPSVGRVIGGAAFAPKPTPEQALQMVKAFVAEHFFDPDAAQLRCGTPGPPAWIKPTLQRRKYGYFLNCNINGKNRFGGYVGFTPFLFRINGKEFESVDASDGSWGLMEPVK